MHESRVGRGLSKYLGRRGAALVGSVVATVALGLLGSNGESAPIPSRSTSVSYHTLGPLSQHLDTPGALAPEMRITPIEEARMAFKAKTHEVAKDILTQLANPDSLGQSLNESAWGNEPRLMLAGQGAAHNPTITASFDLQNGNVWLRTSRYTAENNSQNTAVELGFSLPEGAAARLAQQSQENQSLSPDDFIGVLNLSAEPVYVSASSNGETRTLTLSEGGLYAGWDGDRSTHGQDTILSVNDGAQPPIYYQARDSLVAAYDEITALV